MYALCWGGMEKEPAGRSPKLVDWKQDFQHIAAPVNWVLGQEVWAVEYMHWWTFLSALDDAQLEKNLAGLTKKIEKQERKIADLSPKRDKAKERSLFDGAALDAEKARLLEIKAR